MVRAARLRCRKPPYGCEVEAVLRHATIGKLCQPSSEWVLFFKLGKAKTAKAERWAPPFINCVQDTVRL